MRGCAEGARIGIPRSLLLRPATAPGATTPRGGLDAAQLSVMEEAIAVLQDTGAVIVDPADIPSVVDPDPQQQLRCPGIPARSLTKRKGRTRTARLSSNTA